MASEDRRRVGALVIKDRTRFERDEGGPRMLGTCQDITERHHLEGALRLSEERYRSLIGAITSVVWTADAQGRFVETQPAWEAYTGQNWTSHREWGWQEAVHGDDRKRLAESWAQARDAGPIF